MELVSIIIPVYNVEQYIERCLDSCFNQTFLNIEVLAINDGSNDNSGVILDNYAQKENRLKVFHQENLGVVAARNLGIKEAKGKWLAFVDSDDFLESNAIELLYRSVIDNSSAISVAKFRTVSEQGTFGKENSLVETLNADTKQIAEYLLVEKLPFSLWAKLFHHTLFDEVKSDTNLKLGEDAYVTIQLFGNAKQVSVVDKIVYNYQQRDSSTTHQPSKIAIASIKKFIGATVGYYSTKSYFKDSGFVNSLNYFILKEYFSYLRMGGAYCDCEIKDLVNNIALNDKIACSLTPMWRVLMLKAYRVNIHLGKLVRTIILTLRKVRG